ncbi:glycosyltransferase family 4 protein [Candidatus Saccharibacteria bacterium]|nr:glycosyltransferase family 4 protein [Candidatus Saccharibacteria bacterium]
MKIGLVCPYNLFKGGGVQECVIAMQLELVKRGHDALIIAPQPKETPDDVPEFVRLLGRARDVKSPFHTTAQISVTVEPKEVERLLEHEKFDVLHFHEPWVPLLSRQILIRSNTKNVATFHAKLPDTMMSRTIERVITPYTKSILKYLDSYTAVSTAASEYVSELTDDPITIVPNGIDLRKYTSGDIIKPDQKSVLFVGRLEKRKGVTYLLRAMAEVQKRLPQVYVDIVGDGPDRAKLEAMVHDLGLKHVRFHGKVDDAEKIRMLHAATVFSSPARYGESFGIVLLEAMAAGTPIVAGDNPGYRAVMQETGLLSIVDPQDTMAFAARLELLLTDETLARHWIDWAREYVKQFAYPRVVDRYEAIYEQVTR